MSKYERACYEYERFLEFYLAEADRGISYSSFDNTCARTYEDIHTLRVKKFKEKKKAESEPKTVLLEDVGWFFN